MKANTKRTLKLHSQEHISEYKLGLPLKVYCGLFVPMHYSIPV